MWGLGGKRWAILFMEECNLYIFAKTAIAGQTICNGYFSTDEDDEKVLDWYKKQYPWLFPDQAWTVVGKTNEDEDRATIANITGNGNDLVLSNLVLQKGVATMKKGNMLAIWLLMGWMIR